VNCIASYSPACGELLCILRWERATHAQYLLIAMLASKVPSSLNARGGGGVKAALSKSIPGNYAYHFTGIVVSQRKDRPHQEWPGRKLPSPSALKAIQLKSSLLSVRADR